MVPILTQETVSQFQPGDSRKFVREGGVIAFADTELSDHLTVAKEYNLGEALPKTPQKSESRLLDDAGTVWRQNRGPLTFIDQSMGCRVRHQELGRTETKRIAEEILKQEVSITEP